MQNIEHWIHSLFEHKSLLGMGHAQTKEDLNLGLGWLYYALARLHRPKKILIIGSHRGFTPMVFARALKDNLDSGQVIFIDPSLVDDFWKSSDKVQNYFSDFELDNIQHHLYTTQDFINTSEYKKLNEIDILFVDGYHSYEQAKFDHLAFKHKLSQNALIFFHDSTSRYSSKIYGEEKRYAHSVIDYMSELKQEPDLQVMDFAYDSGVTLVKKV